MAKRHTHAERVDRSRLFMTLLSFPDRRRLTAANVAPRGPFQTMEKEIRERNAAEMRFDGHGDHGLQACSS